MKKNKKFMGLLIPAIITLVLGFVLLVPGFLLKSEMTGSVGFDPEVAKAEIDDQLYSSEEVDTLYERLDGIAGVDYVISPAGDGLELEGSVYGGYSIWYTPNPTALDPIERRVSYSINVEDNYPNSNILEDILRKVEELETTSTSAILSKGKNVDLINRNIEEKLDVKMRDLIFENFKFYSEFKFIGAYGTSAVEENLIEDITLDTFTKNGIFTIIPNGKLIVEGIANTSGNYDQYPEEEVEGKLNAKITFDHEIVIETNFAKQIVLIVFGSMLLVSSIVLFPIYGLKKSKQNKQEKEIEK